MNEKGISLVQLRQRKHVRQQHFSGTCYHFISSIYRVSDYWYIYYKRIPVEWYFRRQEDGRTCKLGKLIKDTKFWIAFKNNVIIMILSIIIQIPLGLAMATFLDFGGKKLTIFKVIWFILMLMSSVAIGFLFTYALATNGGIVAQFRMVSEGATLTFLVIQN